MERSKIEAMILDPGFDYLQPWFYNNPYALRCELGGGKTKAAYMRRARQRAKKIYEILFPHGADAIIFSYCITDWSDSGEPDAVRFGETEETIRLRLRRETQALRFLSECMMKYRHVSVKGLKTDLEPDDPDWGSVRRNRIVCYADDGGFDDRMLMEHQLVRDDGRELGLVSFDNECILSVYDDRGCDAVFATYEKMAAFYPLLEPFFLDYDRAEMKNRLAKGSVTSV